MQAIRFHEYGPPDVLRLEDAPRPEPGEGEVLVRVRTAGVNPIDWKLRAGYLQAFMPVELPHVLGFDLAGTVEAVGAGVTGFAPGDDVFGRGASTYAEYAVAPATTLAPKPAAVSYSGPSTQTLRRPFGFVACTSLARRAAPAARRQGEKARSSY